MPLFLPISKNQYPLTCIDFRSIFRNKIITRIFPIDRFNLIIFQSLTHSEYLAKEGPTAFLEMLILVLTHDHVCADVKKSSIRLLLYSVIRNH